MYFYGPIGQSGRTENFYNFANKHPKYIFIYFYEQNKFKTRGSAHCRVGTIRNSQHLADFISKYILKCL